MVSDILGNANAAGLGDAFEPRGDIHGVAQEIAIVADHDVPERDSDPEQQPSRRVDRDILRIVGILNVGGAAGRIDRAFERDQNCVPGGVENPAMVPVCALAESGGRLPKPADRAFLIRGHQPAVARHVRCQDDGKLAPHIRLAGQIQFA